MERQEDNDLFYTCSLIEYIARITENKKSVIVNIRYFFIPQPPSNIIISEKFTKHFFF